MRKICIVLIIVFFSSLVHSQSSTPFRVAKFKKFKKKIRQQLAQNGLYVKRMVFKGACRALGEFWDADSIFQMSHGFVLSTGLAQDAAHINDSNEQTGLHHYRGRQLLRSFEGTFYDAAVLQLDFYPSSDYFSFNFVFASEEYPEFTQTGQSDLLALLLTLPNGNQVNLAQLPASNDRVGVSSIHQQNRAQYYINNCISKESVSIKTLDTIVVQRVNQHLVLARKYNTDLAQQNKIQYPIQYDGFTKVLKAQYPVMPQQKYRLQIIIADRANKVLDSAVFLELASFHSHSNPDFLSGILARDPYYYYTVDTLLNESYQAKKRTSACTTILPDILFDYDSPILKTTYLENLKEVATHWHNCQHLGVQIEGFAAANDGNYNIQLSRKRAQKVRDYLVKYGIPKTKIRITWKGTEGLKNKQESLLNRRVQLRWIQL